MLCLLAGLLAWIGYREIRSLRTQLDAVPEMIGTRVALSEWQGATATNAARVVAILKSNDVALGEFLSEDVKATSLLRSEEHTSELQSPDHLVCRLLLEKKKK